jgi:hypothetical protein
MLAGWSGEFSVASRGGLLVIKALQGAAFYRIAEYALDAAHRV